MTLLEDGQSVRGTYENVVKCFVLSGEELRALEENGYPSGPYSLPLFVAGGALLVLGWARHFDRVVIRGPAR